MTRRQAQHGIAARGLALQGYVPKQTSLHGHIGASQAEAIAAEMLEEEARVRAARREPKPVTIRRFSWQEDEER